MRFERFPHWTPRTATPKRLANARQAIERQAASVPLFADQIRVEQTAEERLAAIETQNARWWQRLRDVTARQWKAARAALWALPEATRRELLARWNAAPFPGSSECFADFVRGYVRLRRDPAQIPVENVFLPPAPPTGTVEPRTQRR